MNGKRGDSLCKNSAHIQRPKQVLALRGTTGHAQTVVTTPQLSESIRLTGTRKFFVMSHFAFTRKFPWSFVVALLLCLAVWAFKTVLEGVAGGLTPFLLFFGAIILATWIGGLEAGVFATVVSVLLVNYFSLEPLYSLQLSWANWIQIGIFVVEGFFIALLTSLARSTQERYRAQAERQQALTELSQFSLSSQADLTPLFERAAVLGARTLDARVALLQLERDSDDDSGDVGDSGEGDDSGQARDFLLVRASSQSDEVGRRVPLSPDSPVARVLLVGLAAGEKSGALHVPVGEVARFWGVLGIEAEPTRLWMPEQVEWARAVANILGVAINGQLARQRAAQGETRYRSFVEHSSEAIWRFEMEEPIPLWLPRAQILEASWDFGVLAECNDNFARMYGFERAQEMVGMRLWQIMDRDEPAAIAYLNQIFDADLRLTDAESVELDAEGNRKIFLNNLVGIVEENKLLRVWGTQRDVTQAREAERELSESEHRFRSLFDAAPIPLGIGRDNRLLYVNRAMVRLTGCEDAAQLIGAPATDLVAPELREELLQRARNRKAGGDEPTSYESRALRCDGTEVPVRIELAQLALPDGEATLMFLFDLTQQKRADAEIAQLLQNAVRATERAQNLQQISFDLLSSSAPEEVAKLAIERVVAVLGATSGVLMAPDDAESPELLQTLDAQGYSQDVLEPLLSVDVHSPHLVAHVFRTREPLWISDALDWRDRFPELKETLPRTGTRAIAVIPLEVEGRVNGVLALSFAETREFRPEQRLFLLTLSNSCAQALECARLDAQTRELARSQRESLALLNTVLESAPVGFALLDREGRYLLINSALAAMNGAPVEAHIGQTTREMAPEPAFERRLEEVWQSGKPSGEFVLTDAGPNQDHADENNANEDGSDERRYCLTSLYPVRVRAADDNPQRAGEVLGVGVIVIDISERVRAEEEKSNLMGELETERARFEAILQQMPSAVIIAEAPSGKMLLSNEQTDRVMGQPVALEDFDDYGNYLAYRPDGTRVGAHDWPLSRAIERGETIVDEEIVLPQNIGSGGTDNRVLRVSAAPIRNREGEITAGVAILDDVTASARSAAAQRFLAAAGSALIATLDEESALDRLAKLCVPDVADWCIVAVPDANGFLREASIAHRSADEEATDEEATDEENADADLARRFRARLEVDAAVPWEVRDVLRDGRARVYPSERIEDLRRANASEEYAELMREIGAVVGDRGAPGGARAHPGRDDLD